MNRAEFIAALTKKLGEQKVPDIADIAAEYDEHFSFKLADGYSEEEIAAKLGNPEELAKQFAAASPAARVGRSGVVPVAIGLAFADIVVAMLFALLLGWVVALGAFSIASAASAVCLIFDINCFSLIPQMPYWCACIFFIATAALAVLSAVGTVYCFLFIRQILRAYCRWHKNVLAAARGNPVFPPLAKYPQVGPKANRRLRSIALISLTIFAVSFVAGFIVSAVSAGAIEFWHAWNWFV